MQESIGSDDKELQFTPIDFVLRHYNKAAKYTPCEQTLKKAMQHISNGKSLEYVAAYIYYVPKKRLLNWMKDYPEFNFAISTALDMQKVNMWQKRQQEWLEHPDDSPTAAQVTVETKAYDKRFNNKQIRLSSKKTLKENLQVVYDAFSNDEIDESRASTLINSLAKVEDVLETQALVKKLRHDLDHIINQKDDQIRLLEEKLSINKKGKVNNDFV